MSNENEVKKIREEIELTSFLTKDQIQKILDLAVKRAPTGNYEAKVEIKVLLDELRKRGLQVDNKFKTEGTTWKCPKCERMLSGVAKCVCGYENKDILPKGTYEFLFEKDLGRVGNHCQNYACGHPIRFEEHILHVETGRRYIVGNVCVTHILGEHDLVKVAVSLLAKCSRKVEKLNKAEKCDKICGEVLRKAIEIDPKHWFTREEFLFLDAIKGAQTKLTLKKAKEFADKWTDEALKKLKEKVKTKKKDQEETAKMRDEEVIQRQDDWLIFLRFMKRRQRDRDSDFWDNCIEVTDRDGQPTPGQRNAIQKEFDVFAGFRSRDKSILDGLSPENKLIGEKLFDHCAECDSEYHLGLLMQLILKKHLSERQIDTLKKGCRRCDWKI